MHFAKGIHHADAQIMQWVGPTATRHDVECALDTLISIEPEDGPNYEQDFEKAVQDHKAEFEKANQVLKAYGNQVSAESFNKLQAEFYSFSNSEKYRTSVQVLTSVRYALEAQWGLPL